MNIETLEAGAKYFVEGLSPDYLAPLPESDVHAWYQRGAKVALAKKINNQEPLAGVFLNNYLAPGDGRLWKNPFIFTAPEYLKTSKVVKKGLEYHRNVFLTKKKARIGGKGGKEIFAGIQVRVLKCGIWKGRDFTDKMHYTSNVDIGPDYDTIVNIQNNGSIEEKDLLTSLKGFSLVSEVTFKLTNNHSPLDGAIIFTRWETHVKDRYDFDFGKHITLPNPDFNSHDKKAVRPKDHTIVAFHKNLKRLEDKGLAKPFEIESEKWKVTDKKIIGNSSLSSSFKCSWL